MVAVLHDRKLNIANSVRTERRGKTFKGKKVKKAYAVEDANGP